ncbi:MAG: aminotransferase class I/II-fold pyridoxal phosphate-dependent enzyme [Candidatus Micrarchaeota archaeon]
MSLERIAAEIDKELKQIADEGRSKAPERVIVEVVPPKGENGPRFKLKGSDKEFLKMNSNGYLGLAYDARLKKAAHEATEKLGVGPTAVRFIDGTYSPHIELEGKLAKFHHKEAAKIFSSAYMANLGLAITVTNPKTYYISDELNHNSIIRSLRIAGVKSENKTIFKHNNIEDLEAKLKGVPAGMERIIVVFDGVFSMRGDNAPMDKIVKACGEHDSKFKDGVITVVDDSHGTAAYGATGRGTPEVANGMNVDIVTSTMGKGIGSNGGYVAASAKVIELMRQRADTYIYTNPIAVADAAASSASLGIIDSIEGKQLLAKVKENAIYFRKHIEGMGFETLPGQHPIVPVLVRDTTKTKKLVSALFEKGILVVGLTFPVVPKGDETIRTQLCANHTKADVDYAIDAFAKAGKEIGIIN